VKPEPLAAFKAPLPPKVLSPNARAHCMARRIMERNGRLSA
jgi:hypothetical protein